MVDGVRYHYAEAGSGEPLVLLHGFPQNWYMWRDLIPGLAKHYRVIAPDTRGAGWTDAPNGGYGKDQLADDIAKFMDNVGAPRARVMGHDWGGFIGFMLAMRHPDKVSQYLALDIATPWPNAKFLPNAWRLLYQPVLAAPLLGAALLRQPLFVKSMLWGASKIRPWSDKDVSVFAAPFRDAARAAAGSEMYRTFLKKDIIPWARGDYKKTRLEPPTLLLVGEHDPVIRPSLIEGYEKYSRDMHAEYLPGAGHFLPEEQPEVVLDRALTFFGAGRPA
jgi:pimeloyl-ACP methyl ester carboxylesterase